MKKSLKVSSILLSAVLLSNGLGANVYAEGKEPLVTQEVETDQVIVTFKEELKSEPEELDIVSVKTVETEEIATLKVPEGETVETYTKELEARTDVKRVEPDYLVQLTHTPNDPYFNYFQYHHDNIETERAWDKTKGSSDVVVAVLDSGFDLNHQDLTNQIISAYSTSSTGFSVDDHGTHVAGIIGSSIDNYAFGAGVAPETSIMAIDVFEGEFAYTTDVVEGIYTAVSAGADIINMSLGSYESSYYYNNAIQYAYQNGVVIVAAAGNDATTRTHYPSSYDNVISVGSTTSYDGSSSFSNYGYDIDIVAPGSGIYSTLPYGSFGSMNGTSMASPVVAGVAALVLANEPQLTNDQVVNRLLTTTKDLGSYGKDYIYGNGLVNARQALKIMDIPSPTVNDIQDDSTSVSGYLPFEIENGKVIIRDQSGNVIGSGDGYSSYSYFDIAIPKQPGGSKLTVSVMDSYGNESEGIEISVLDGTAPEKPDIDTITDQSTSITGGAEPGAEVIISESGQSLYSSWVDENGFINVPITPIKADTKLSIVVSDAAGNTSEPAEVTVKDVTAPSKPKANAVTEEAVRVTGTAEAGSTVTVKSKEGLLGEALTASNGIYSIAIAKQKAGVVLFVNSTDKAGNTSAATELTVKDSSIPTAPVVNSVTDKMTQVTGSAEAGATVSVKANGNQIGTAVSGTDSQFTVTIAKQKAGTILTVTATDQYDNASAATEVTVKDVTAPTVPAVDKVKETSIAVTGTGEVNALVTVKNGATVLGTATVDRNGMYAVAIAKQKVGTVLSVIATDQAGNSSAAKEVTVTDGTAPAITLKNKVTHHSTRVIGTAEAAAQVVVKNGTTTIGKATSDAKGEYEVKIGKQKVGTKLSIVATDVAGNSSAAIPVTVVDGNYPDLKVVHWALDEIMYLADDQIIGGYPDGGFQPEKNTTRAEAAKMLALALDLKIEDVSSGYKDVPDKHWGKNYIAAVSKAGLFTGNPDGTFAPNDVLKRAEMAKVISIAYELKASDKNHFSDVKSGYWAKGYISGLYENGITTGYPDKTFHPLEPTTRAEYSVFLARAMNEGFR
ncbi:S8 family serine peptidase [Planococcus sp. CPCC 101016]|uniref:Ig-like domain-containing protein n=1 Tax=Planococcus sp. CPCC 101016 TaxID=2599617 RepID=UPI0011B62E21|nr:Ig-like domain-containing protein [Planococcus sp. CPCC 101016]TWT07053.1 S8 family serine peptidase [Planococcus sp. CPCC 101016]